MSAKLTWFIFSVISGEGSHHKRYRVFFFPWAGFLVSRKQTAVKGCSPKQPVKIQTVLEGGGKWGQATQNQGQVH